MYGKQPDRFVKPDDLYVVELDERLEFGAAIVDSDLQADTNTGCINQKCYDNGFGCDNVGCKNDIC
jgi:hypothetical protein